MKVIIPALSPDCPASLTLQREGVDHTVCILEEYFTYSQLMTKLWEEGEGFIIVEHDIAPFVGAITDLEKCMWDWCGYHYSLDPGNLHGHLGCTKFSDELVSSTPGLSERWEGAKWNELDGIMTTAVIEALAILRKTQELEQSGLRYFHIHRPPLAHVKGY